MFNVEFYGKLFPKKESKQKIVAEVWKELKFLIDTDGLDIPAELSAEHGTLWISND